MMARTIEVDDDDVPQPWRETAAHIALHDPQDVIADADAKLAILDEHATTKTYAVGEDMRRVRIDVCETCRNKRGVPCATVRLLAQGYRHRDGWRKEWAT
ncbi:hypothetical protein BJF79_13620 [Actinomadura sp. CNU-125]|nr:hypothetical protein BJF79_13620 [Actinomadura sp. CNU-125]